MAWVHGFQNDTAHIRVSLEKGLVQLPEPLHGLLGPLQGMGGIVLGVGPPGGIAVRWTSIAWAYGIWRPSTSGSPGMGGIVLGVVGGLSPQFRLGAGLLEFRQLVFQICRPFFRQLGVLHGGDGLDDLNDLLEALALLRMPEKGPAT